MEVTPDPTDAERNLMSWNLFVVRHLLEDETLHIMTSH